MNGARESVTVWNRTFNPLSRKDEWVRHVVDGFCRWQGASVRAARDGVARREEAVSVAIGFDERCHVERLYLKPSVWQGLSAADKVKYFTVQTGDILARGVHEDWLLSGEGGDCVSDLLAALGGEAFVAESVEDLTQDGRRGPHLLVTG